MSFRREGARALLADTLTDARLIFGEDGSPEQQTALYAHLATAVTDYNRVRPRIEAWELQLVAGQQDYPAPPGALRFHLSDFVDANNALDPYDPRHLYQVPIPTLIRDSAGGRVWRFSPAPSARLIGVFGSRYRYTAVVAHVLSDVAGDTTFWPEDLPQLVMRAQVESLRALAVRNAHKPFTTRDPSLSQTRNGTPAALADQIFRDWERMVREGFQS